MAIIKLQGEAEKRKGIYYEVDSSLDPIGEGGTGKVYEGRCVNAQTGESRPVAIKFMFTELSEQIIERARREASIQLRNDNLIEMLGFIETETNQGNNTIKHYHVVSELLHGVSLADVLSGKCVDAQGCEVPYARKLFDMYCKEPDRFAKLVIINVLSGIMALHDARYIHRDIDPSNIMITNDEHIKLIDFGICKQMGKLTTHDKVQTVAGVFMGKPEYASPELALGDIKHQDQTTDIYAIGILLYQCIVGHVPFEGKRFEVLDKQVKAKVPTKAVQNARLRRIIDKACEKRQEKRYQTAAEMRVAIESLDMKRATDHRRKHIIIAAAAALLLIVVVSGIGIMQYLSRQELKQALIIEKNRNDSLLLVIDDALKTARELAARGYLHDEGFDRDLIKSKQMYEQADAASKQLTSTENLPDYKADKQKLDEALVSAHNELLEKAHRLSDDPDPVVAEEASTFFARVKEIEAAMK